MTSENHGCWPLWDVDNISMSWSIRAKFLMIGQKIRPPIWWKIKHLFYNGLSWTPWKLIKYYPLTFICQDQRLESPSIHNPSSLFLLTSCSDDFHCSLCVLSAPQSWRKARFQQFNSLNPCRGEFCCRAFSAVPNTCVWYSQNLSITTLQLCQQIWQSCTEKNAYFMPSCNWREILLYRKKNCCNSLIGPSAMFGCSEDPGSAHTVLPPPSHWGDDADSPSEKICCLSLNHICLVSPSQHPGPVGTESPSISDTT